ncbi:MAG: ROK family protein [Pseudomonadota bacterium]
MASNGIKKHEDMRQSNTATIFEHLRKNGPLTKKQLQSSTKLSWGTVSNVSAALLKNGIICELKNEDSSIGRKPIELDINPFGNMLIGIDANLEGLTGVLIDLKCRAMCKFSESLLAPDMQSVMKQIRSLIERLIAKAGSKERILGIGVALPGHVDITNGISKYNPHFNGSHNYRIKEILEREFGIETLIEHDPNCAALTEQMMGVAQNVDNFLFIRLSVGIGMSVVISNEIYRGADGSAGELGHIVMDPDGPKCECGKYGCLETYSSCSSIIARAEYYARKDQGSILGNALGSYGHLTISSILDAAQEGDENACDILFDAAEHLGIAIANMVNILNPDMVVLGGELSKCDEYFVRHIRKTVKKHLWGKVEADIRVSGFSGEAAAIGAASIFIRKILNGEHELLNKI